MTLAAGWYPVAGDPPGTKRYWDGASFNSDAVRDPNVYVSDGPVSGPRNWQLASPYARLVAAIVDYLAPIIVFVGIARATGFGLPTAGSTDYLEYRNMAIAWGGFWLINQVVFLAYWGTTLGKTVVGIRVVQASDSGQYPGLARAIVRSVLTLPLLVISLVFVMYGKRRTFNDVAAGTACVYT